jgi:uncharacterized protein (PEP-CTERM system associated)
VKQKILVACLLSVCTSLAFAAGWRASPGITSRFFFTDNLFLTPNEKESDAVLQVLPSITLRRPGRRVNARLAYGPSLFFYANNSELNNLYHILQGGADMELIERYFFLNVRANANQQLINPRARATFDAVDNPDAFTQTASIRVTPDIRVPVFAGDYANIRIRPGLTYSFAADTVDGVNDGGVGGRDTQVNITSGPVFTRMPWRLNYRKRLFDSDTNDGFGRADATVGYIFNPRYRADLTLGYDDGRYASRNATSGVRWRLAGTWTPSQRTLLRVGVGEAFFGGDWELRFRHRHKHSVWTAEYDVDVTNARQEIIDRQVIFFEDPFGNPIIDPITGQRIGVEVGTPALIDDVFVQERFRLGWSWVRGRTNVRLNLRYDRRKYQEVDFGSNDGRLNLNVSRRLTGQLSGRVGLDYWDHNEDDPNDSFDFDQYAARIGFNYQLGPRSNASLDFLRTDRSADNPFQEFSENRVELGVAYRWDRGL